MQGKDKLKKDVEKKIKTTMIGAISIIEEEFGFLFGHEKEELSKEEEAFNKVFQDIRCKILDLGNNQIKKSKLDIELYEVNGPYYKYDFKINRN